MARHRDLFQIDRSRRILKTFLIGFSLFTGGAATYYFISILTHAYFPVPWLSHPLFLIAIVTGFSVLFYRPLDFVFTEVFKRYLFKKRSYIHIMLMNLAEELELILDLQELANLIVNTLGELLHLKTVALIVHDHQNQDFRIASAYGWNVSDYRRLRIDPNSPLPLHIRQHGPHVLVRNRDVRMLEWQDANRLAHDFDAVRAGWVIPLWVKDDLVGFIAFAAHEPDRTFDEADFQFFRRFALSISKKVHNALHLLEYKQLNDELKDSQSRLMQVTKLSAIEQLATGLAHQIHNPLTIISGKAQILLLQKDRVPLDDRVQEVLKTIVKQTKRAADITKKLLMFSQGSGIPKEGLSLDQIVEDALVLISYQTSLGRIKVEKSFDSDLPALFGNLQEMREVFFNLILNAVQSIGDREGKINLRVGYREPENAIEVQIQDSGCGIREDQVDKIFNPFFTTRHDALGLGLFVTKQIIHRMGGSIRVESRFDEGSLFIVMLPCSEMTEVNEPSRAIMKS